MPVEIGDFLFRTGRINGEQLKLGRDYQAHHDCRLQQGLIEMGFISEMEAIRAEAELLEIPLIDLSDTVPSPECLTLFPPALAQEFEAIPIRLEGGKVLVATSDPENVHLDDQVWSACGRRVIAAAAPRSQVRKYLDSHYLSSPLETTVVKLDEEEGVSIEESARPLSMEVVQQEAETLSASRVVDFLIADTIRKGASDLHIEAEADGIRVRSRIDGLLRPVVTLERSLLPRIVARIKIMAGMDISECRKPQDGASRAKVDGQSFDLRVSTLPGIHGETVVARILNHSPSLLNLSRLGLREDMETKILAVLESRQGMLLITGPTGCGKTTTLYSALNHLREQPVNIITVEDPVEYMIAGITQVQVNERAERSFPQVLRSIVRQDPDVIMVGEIRDLETAEIACRSALTGHLVLSTLHTQDAVGALTRLLDIGVPPYIVTASLLAVMAQRLVRRVCERCAEPAQPSPALLEAFEERFGASENAQFRRGAGCPECFGTGTRGRVGVYELALVDAPVRRLLGKGGSPDELRTFLQQRGFRTMEYDAFDKACHGLIPPEEVVALGMSLER